MYTYDTDVASDVGDCFKISDGVNMFKVWFWADSFDFLISAFRSALKVSLSIKYCFALLTALLGYWP